MIQANLNIPPSLPYFRLPSAPPPSTAIAPAWSPKPQDTPSPFLHTSTATETILQCHHSQKADTRRFPISTLSPTPPPVDRGEAALFAGLGTGREKRDRVNSKPQSPTPPYPVLRRAHALQARPTQRPSDGQDCEAQGEKGAHQSTAAWRARGEAAAQAGWAWHGRRRDTKKLWQQPRQRRGSGGSSKATRTSFKPATGDDAATRSYPAEPRGDCREEAQSGEAGPGRWRNPGAGSRERLGSARLPAQCVGAQFLRLYRCAPAHYTWPPCTRKPREVGSSPPGRRWGSWCFYVTVFFLKAFSPFLKNGGSVVTGVFFLLTWPVEKLREALLHP